METGARQKVRLEKEKSPDDHLQKTADQNMISKPAFSRTSPAENCRPKRDLETRFLPIITCRKLPTKT